ncbi:substrate-binding domain-containing protein [Anaerorhabdus sp.]|uniref:substrate-binding domain-containing protein n=2 Tax=Anaerorhabdus sp. TaxID=1872524 RepID=UPI002FC8CE1A
MKKVLSFLVTLLLVVGLAGCSTGETPAKTATPATGGNTDPAKMVVGLSVSTLNNPFFVTLVDGAKAKAAELGVELIVVDAGDDSAKQVNDIEDLMSKNIQVLIVNPVDSSAVAPVVGDAIAKGIKTVSVDRGVEGQTVDVAIASDNVKGAELATEYLVELVGQGAEVAELTGIEGSSAAIDRGKGFHNVADAKLNVVASQTANFNRAEGLSVMENILQANPNILGVFAHNDEMALGAIEAVNGKDIVIIGFDATDDALAAIKAGTMAATVAQKPALMGETAVDAAVKLIKGETVDSVIGVEVELVKE